MSETLQAIAVRAMKETGNDVPEACRLAWKWVQADPALYAEVILPLAMSAFDDECRHYLTRIRALAWAPPQASGEAKMSASLRLGHQQVAEDRLLAYPLRSGKQLGDATKDDVKVDSHYYLKSSHTNLVRGTWLEMIAARLKGKTVREQFTERQLASLQKSAEARVAK